MNAEALAVEAEGLGRELGGRWVVAGVNVQLRRGTSLAIAGPNGAGKTTLLRLLATTLAPTTGRLRIGGLDPETEPQRVRQGIAMVGHRTALYEDLTAAENLRVVADLLGHRTGAARRRALLARVGLADHAHAPVRHLSAGMRKRLSLGRALLQDPELLLLDEPWGQLDPDGQALVDELLRELPPSGCAVVAATHRPEHAAETLRTGLQMADGRMRWAGPARQLPEAPVGAPPH